MGTIPITVNVPTFEDLLAREPRLYLSVREMRDGNPPFTEELRNLSDGYSEKSGIYVHIWDKDDGSKVIRYVGQTSGSFRDRMNTELTLQNKPCSKYFVAHLRKHIGKHDLSTVFFDDEEIADMVKVTGGIKPSAEALRFLVEQAMTVAYSSPDMLNVHKSHEKQQPSGK